MEISPKAQRTRLMRAWNWCVIPAVRRMLAATATILVTGSQFADGQSPPTPPAFGPGSAGYGQPFFNTPGQVSPAPQQPHLGIRKRRSSDVISLPVPQRQPVGEATPQIDPSITAPSLVADEESPASSDETVGPTTPQSGQSILVPPQAEQLPQNPLQLETLPMSLRQPMPLTIGEPQLAEPAIISVPPQLRNIAPPTSDASLIEDAASFELSTDETAPFQPAQTHAIEFIDAPGGVPQTSRQFPIVVNEQTRPLPGTAMEPSGNAGVQLYLGDAPAATWMFHFQDAPWPVVLRNFAQFSQMSLVMETTPSGSLNYYDERPYSVNEALDVLNDHLLREGFILVRNESKLTVIAATNSFRDGVVPFVSLRVIPTLGRNELVSVAFPLRTSATPQIIAEIQQLVSPVGKVLPLSNSSRVIVTDTGASLRRLRDLMMGSGLAASEVERMVLRLRNTKADQVAAAVNQRLGYGSGSSGSSASLAGGGPVIGASGMGEGFASPIPSSSSNSGNSGGTGVVAEAQTNTLLIEGTPEELAQIESLVREIDCDPGQVMIQALLVEVMLGNSREQGVELGFQDSVLFDRSVIDNVVSLTQTTTASNGVQTTNQNIISQTASPGFNFNGAPLGNNVTVNPGKVGTQSVSNLGLGRVSGDLGFGGLVLSAGSNSVNVLLRALAEKHKLEVLSRPHVRTVNNHEALIQIGQQVPIVDGVTISPNGLANPVVRQDKAGIILRVTPRISDNGVVQIDVQAEKSAYQLIAGSGVPIFTDANTGNVIEAPVKDITTAQTTVTAVSGQTIVLGGMITRDDTVVERKVPFLGDIPLIGRLFRVDLKSTNRKELLIFLTPTIVNDAFVSDDLSRQESSRITIAPNPNIDLHTDFLRGLEPAPPGLNSPTLSTEYGLIE